MIFLIYKKWSIISKNQIYKSIGFVSSCSEIESLGQNVIFLS